MTPASRIGSRFGYDSEPRGPRRADRNYKNNSENTQTADFHTEASVTRSHILTYACGEASAGATHSAYNTPSRSTPYRSRLRERTEVPCPRDALASASATERTQDPPTPRRVTTSPAQQSTAEGAPWPIPRNCPPASPPPWPLLSQRRGLVRRPRPPQNILRADQRTFPPPMPTPIPQHEGRCIHVCICRFSFEAPHLVVPLTWQASGPP